MNNSPQPNPRQKIEVNKSSISHSQVGIAGNNILQIGINVSLDFIEKYVLEYIRAWERRFLLFLFVLWIINILVPGIKISLNFPQKYIQIYSEVLRLLSVAILIEIAISILIRNIKNSKTFWKYLSLQQKEIIDKYLEEVEFKIKSNFEFTFNPEQNYVALSGSLGDLYPHQAYEEKLPSGRRQIKNLDEYLLHPDHKSIFVYGTPGSGKSTTLYKTFLNYQKRCRERRGNYIPIFIHASQIARVIKQQQTPLNTVDFLEKIYEDIPSHNLTNFIDLLRRKSEVNLTLIIDALDEFVDKKYRSNLFDYLAKLIKSTSKKGTKWILSCREEEYKAYSDKLEVLNVRVQPMNLSQVDKFLRKRLKTLKNFAGITSKDIISIRKNLYAIKKAEGQRETFLSNPYYLALWLYLLTFSEEGLNRGIPSINELHQVELKREIIKGMGESPAEFEKVENSLLKNTITILSIISFHLLKVSLQNEVHKGISLIDFTLINSLQNQILPYIQHLEYDKVTRKRFEVYYKAILENTEFEEIEEDFEFIKLTQAFKPHIFDNSSKITRKDKTENIKFLILIASIIEQANKNHLIELDIEQIKLFGFFNQRARDYLTASYLKSTGLDKLLKESRVNFWLSRSIAIAIAISENPESILAASKIPQDAVFESAIVDGLTLIPSTQKVLIANFVNSLILHLLDEQRLFGRNYDPCDPLRVLREVRRLCLNGYSKYIKLPNRLFQRLLKHSDPGISEATTITLLTYASQIKFDGKLSTILFLHFLRKSINFELLSEGFLTSIWLAIKESRL